MAPDLFATLAFGAVLLAVVGVGEALRAGAGWAPEDSRRVVHALTGLAVAFCPPFFRSPWPVAALAAAFVVVNVWAVRRRWLPGMHGIARRSWGTATFPLALLWALVACWVADPGRLYALQTAFLVLALADPLASWAGARWGRAGAKSGVGSGVFAAAATALTAAGLVLWGPSLSGGEVLALGLSVALAATGAEWLGRRGWDNLFVVAAAVTVLLVVREGLAGPGAMLAGLLGGAAFAVVSWRVGFVDTDGAVAVALLAASVLALGPAWAVPGVTFFVLSSVLSRLGRERKAAAEARAAKGSRRDAGQVYSNGGVSWALLVGYVVWPDPAWYWGYAAAFAAAAADTWATEIGTWLGGEPRSVLTGRRVPRGASGGVTLAGTLGAVAGAAAVFASLVPFAGPYVSGVGWPLATALVIGGGFAASLVDSVLGAGAQAVYRAPGGGLTERPGADGRPHALVRGWAWLDNDRVNLACTLTGGLLPLLLLAR